MLSKILSIFSADENDDDAKNAETPVCSPKSVCSKKSTIDEPTDDVMAEEKEKTVTIDLEKNEVFEPVVEENIEETPDEPPAVEETPDKPPVPLLTCSRARSLQPTSQSGSERPRTSSKFILPALKPTVLTLAMLLPTTSRDT